ncbi:Regulator of nonsense transcripts 1 homolog, putative [Brugia malayi]|uniref:BMA-ERI-7 n=1 Tax=Brugia malayi TaxID=6279 RepID=A0A0K0J725_BRUMA|nr:Regulator of nonsense transcripts 1 homolog, putative [Brugia malayi]CRZ22665.1 BMA-ERI-7 [Brugia malayi]VIO87696.1 Regulator of nonsense transcripts 1 homolog, putative [Brugia malayi]
MFRHIAFRLETCLFSGYMQNFGNHIQNSKLRNCSSLDHDCIRRKSACNTRYSKKPRKHMKNFALHSDFYEKVNRWKELLKNEVAHGVKEIRDLLLNPSVDELEKLGQISGALRFQTQYLHALHGRVIVLHQIKGSEQKITKRSFRSGTPVLLCRIPELTIISNCIIISCSGNQVSLKTKAKKEVNIDFSDEFVLIPSVGLGYLIALDEFLELRWRDFPGEKLIHYVHCSVPLPTSRPVRLNEDQRRAVFAALNKSRPIVTIHGPPGTGKTAVIAEIVLEAVSRKQKVLICAPSNIAVNNIVDRLKDLAGICALGFNSELSLAAELEQHDRFVDIQCAFKKLDSGESNGIYGNNCDEHKKVWHDASKMLWHLKETIVSSKQVIVCTLTNNSLRFLREHGFQPTLTVIDEAAQALECVAWYSLLLSPRAVIVGDPWQLPPVLKTSRLLGMDDISNSLMDTLSKRFGEANSFMLTEQYRMNRKIMEWPSSFFYQSQLRPNEHIADQLLSDISKVPKGSLFDEPMIFIDTSHDKSAESSEKLYRHSYANALEAKLIIKYVTALSMFGVQEKDIGIIAPYVAQVDMLKKSLKTSRVNSVDAFQGQECEVIVMSLVRNNGDGRIGFLKDERRFNVAVTRARRQFVLVGSAIMMKYAKHLRSLIEYMQRHGRIIKQEEFARCLAISRKYSKKNQK